MLHEPALDKDWVVLLGSTSSVGRHLAYEFAQAGYALLLGARIQEENEAIANDIKVRFDVPVIALPFDVLDMDQHSDFVNTCRDRCYGLPKGLVVCTGSMHEQEKAEKDFALARQMLDVNLTGVVSITEAFATPFAERGNGFIAVISSVAGDRGRKKNYLYGAAKGGLHVYLQGLRNRLQASGVQVTTIKPGFMDTKMTFGMDLPGLLTASPEDAAKAMYRAIIRGRDVVYVPFFWRYIMLIIRAIPEFQFKKMDI